MLTNLPKPTLFAHRGSSAHAPENTLAAFELAVQQGADAIELDAKLCRSGEIVVIHDPTVDRTTNGTGKVCEMDLAALKELDAGSFFGPSFTGEKIPTLEEIFELVGQRTFINVELTNYTSLRDNLPEKTVELVKRHGLENRILFSSFNPLALKRTGPLLPQAPRGLLALPGGAGRWARSRLSSLFPYQALHPEQKDVTPGLVEMVHGRGKRVHVYTVNDPDMMRYLFGLQVDGIFTDDPILAQQVRLETRAGNGG
jgi:glycerophosphoryl diester phosphodiesterase